MSCSAAVARFFEAASRARIARLADPAGRCGEIDPRMNYARLRKALDESAELARQAIDAEQAWQTRDLAHDGVTHPSVFWQEIFGRHRFSGRACGTGTPSFPRNSPPLSHVTGSTSTRNPPMSRHGAGGHGTTSHLGPTPQTGRQSITARAPMFRQRPLSLGRVGRNLPHWRASPAFPRKNTLKPLRALLCSWMRRRSTVSAWAACRRNPCASSSTGQ